AQQVAEEEPLDLAIPGRGALKSVRERRGEIDLQPALPPTDRYRLLRGSDGPLEGSMETAPGELPPGILDAQECGHRHPRVRRDQGLGLRLQPAGARGERHPDPPPAIANSQGLDPRLRHPPASLERA